MSGDRLPTFERAFHARSHHVIPTHAIRALQSLLNTQGADLVVDGYYGPRTDAAAQRYLNQPGRPSNAIRRANPPTDRPVNRLVVHCAATQIGEDDHVDADEIRRWHLARNFADIGYHYVIKRDGIVEIGRPIDQVGAHVEGHNTGSIGICLIGGYNSDGLPSGPIEGLYTDAQMTALDKLLRDLLAYWPHAKVLGHRDHPGVNKACPSFRVADWWRP